jgi:hypothetical protein
MSSMPDTFRLVPDLNVKPKPKGKVISSFEADPLCSLQGVGGLGLGQQSRAGGVGALGFEPGPKKLPTELLI